MIYAVSEHLWPEPTGEMGELQGVSQAQAGLEYTSSSTSIPTKKLDTFWVKKQHVELAKT